MDLNEIKHNLRKFFRGEETKEGRRLIDRWYHHFDKKPDDLADYSAEEKKELYRELWEGINPSAGFSKKRLQLKFLNHSQSGNALSAKIAAGFIIVLLVSLTGEAFFDITRNSDKPFVVHSGQLQTKVLGTSFNI